MKVFRESKYGQAPFWETLEDYLLHCREGCAVEYVIENNTPVEKIFRDGEVYHVRLPCGETGYMLAEDLQERESK